MDRLKNKLKRLLGNKHGRRFENDNVFINETSNEDIPKNRSSNKLQENEKIINLQDNLENNQEGFIKSKFLSFYQSIAPRNHEKWFNNDLETKLNELNSRYYDSFYHDLFDIDLDNVNKEIDLIQLNIYKRRAAMDKSFENYVRMTNGIAKEIITYYIDFLKNREYENQLSNNSLIKSDISKNSEFKIDGEAYSKTSDNLIDTDENKGFNYEEFFKSDDYQNYGLPDNDREIIEHKDTEGKNIPDKDSNNLYSSNSLGKNLETEGKMGVNNDVSKDEHSNRIVSIKDIPQDEKICKVCGKELPESYSKNICRNCNRKSYAIKIINKLLNHIDPELEFKREDLASLGYEPIQINDYLWTLLEYGLVVENNGKYYLEKKTILDEFIEENSSITKENTKNQNIKKEKESNANEINEVKKIKLSKICLACSKDLAIHNFSISNKNEDGLNKYCKKCLKKINVVKYLNKLLSIVKYDEYFTYEDVKINYNDSMEFNHHIWSIQENDLLNLVDNKYILEDASKINEFLNRYSKFLDESLLSNDKFNIGDKTLENGDFVGTDFHDKSGSIDGLLGSEVFDDSNLHNKRTTIDEISENENLINNEHHDRKVTIAKTKDNALKNVKNSYLKTDKAIPEDIRKFIDDVSTKLDLPSDVKILTKKIFNQFLEKNILNGQGSKVIICACIYIASKKCKIPRTLNEIAIVSNLTKREIKRMSSFLSKELNLNSLQSSPLEYVSRFTSELGFSSEVKSKAIEIIEDTNNKKLSSQYGSSTIAVMALYISSIFLHEEKIKKNSAKFLDVSKIKLIDLQRDFIETLAMVSLSNKDISEKNRLISSEKLKTKSTKFNETIHEDILNYIQLGYSLEVIADLVDITVGTIKVWINKGKKKIKPYDDFYLDYIAMIQYFLGEFMEWFIPIAPENYKIYFKDGSKIKLKSELEKIDNLYLTSFNKSLFIVNSHIDIELIEKNINNEISMKVNSLGKYNNNKKGIVKEIIEYYISFLRYMDY